MAAIFHQVRVAWGESDERLNEEVVMNTRISVMVGLAVLVAFALPAHADTTIKSDDASVEITVPNGWRQTKPRSPAI